MGKKKQEAITYLLSPPASALLCHDRRVTLGTQNIHHEGIGGKNAGFQHGEDSGITAGYQRNALVVDLDGLLLITACHIPEHHLGQLVAMFLEEPLRILEVGQGAIFSTVVELHIGDNEDLGRHKLKHTKDIFRFKHHYILHALDSDILCDLLLAINERRAVELSICSLRNGRDYQRTVCPLKIYSSTQSGRQYLLGYHYRGRHLIFFRLDAIKKVTAGSVEKQYEKYLGFQQKFDEHLWGVSTGPDYNLDHIEMTIHFGPGEEFILHRLDREKRHGRIELLDDQTCRFIADVYDASEMLPWIRTFIGRIVDLQCSNKFVVKTFNDDLRHMEAIYGGETDAV